MVDKDLFKPYNFNIMKKLFLLLIIPFIAFSKEDAESLVKKGFLHYKNMDFESAISCYKRAVRKDPDSPQAWYWYGMAYFRYGMMDHAKNAWERYLNLTDDPYIRYKLKKYWGKHDNGYTEVFTIKGEIKDFGRFSHPKGIFVDKFDNIYIAGYGNDVVLKMSCFGKPILKIPVKKPFGVCVDDSENIYVTSENSVLKFSKAGTLTLKFGKKGRKKGEFIRPAGITLDDHGNIYVADKSGIQKFSKKGKFISGIKDFNLLFAPSSICLDKDGSIWVVDTYGIKHFSPSFNFIGSLTVRANWVFIKDKKFYIAKEKEIIIDGKKEIGIPFSPSSIAVNRFGFVYIAEPKSSNIHVFSPNWMIKKGLDVVINRIDLVNYPMVLLSLTLKGEKYDIPSLKKENIRIVEENRIAYPVGIEDVLKKSDNMGIVFVIEDSKAMKNKKIKKLLFGMVKRFKDGKQGGAVISFSSSVKTIVPFTFNKTEIRDGIESLKFEGEVNVDSILDGLDKGIEELLGLCAKRGIIIFTSSVLKKIDKLERVINYARNNNIPILVVDYKEQKDVILEDISNKTYGKYLLFRKSKEVINLYDFLLQTLSHQSQYIVYYYSPNSSLKWSNEWLSATIELGLEKFGIRDEVSYLIPEGAGAKSSLGKELIEKRLILEELEKIKKTELELKERRKRIKELLKAEEAKLHEKKEEKPHKEKKEEGEEEEEEEKKRKGH
ncbi:TPA: hypothetical protein DCX16_06510 [bacterium]|nr:hypothetical protein [bacterium]